MDIFQFFFVACAVLETDDRSDADGKSKIKGIEQELSVQSVSYTHLVYNPGTLIESPEKT